jgi:hypothetical protein
MSNTDLLGTLTNLTNGPTILTSLNAITGNKSGFRDVTPQQNSSNTELIVSTIISIIIGLIIGCFCVYLSWKCNTRQGYNTAAKVIFALFAYGFGFLYLIYYSLFRAGTCGK